MGLAQMSLEKGLKQMHKKVFVGKAGQKLIFDRDSKEAKRNNMNGGLDAYLFFDLLFKNFSDVEFYMLGNCDSGIEKYNNVTYIDTIEALNGNEFDCGLIFAGVYNKDDRICKYLTKKNKTKWYMFSTDPRCLMQNVQLNKYPEKIYALSNSYVVYLQSSENAKLFRTHYLPLERLMIMSNIKPPKIDKDLSVVISTSSSDIYDREKYIINYVKIATSFFGENKVQVYGRLKEENIKKLGKQYKGVLDYDEFIKVFRRAKYTLCMPSNEGWVTSKYIEALNNDVVPFFHKDYGVELIKNVKNIEYEEDFEKCLKSIKNQLNYDENYKGEEIIKEIEKNIKIRRKKYVY